MIEAIHERDATDRAVELLTHYFEVLAHKSGVVVTHDMRMELRECVVSIVEAGSYRAQREIMDAAVRRG